MTKTTEELKREMYDALDVFKYALRNTPKPMLTGLLESSLEAYLEALRQELQQWKDIADERDLRSATLRNKLQAFEFANRSAAELLSEALRETSGLRKSVGSMVHQNQPDFVPHDDSKVLPGRRFSKEQCAHDNIYKDIAAGPRTFRCSDCGAESELWGQK